MFLSIFLQNQSAPHLEQFFDNISKTAHDPTSFEVLIQVNNDDYALLKIIKDYQEISPFIIKYLALPRHLYKKNECKINDLIQLAHRESYFFWLLDDQAIIKTSGWDTVLKKMIGFYKDDIFRINVSEFQSKNYADIEDCIRFPERYPIFTRRWLEITEGWSKTSFVSAWQQCIDYYLGLSKNATEMFGIWRSLPIVDIKLESPRYICPEKAKSTLKNNSTQKHLKKLAAKLNVHISAIDKGANEYLMLEDNFNEIISAIDTNSVYRYKLCSYHIPRAMINFFIGYKKLTIKHIFPRIWPLFKVSSILLEFIIISLKTLIGKYVLFFRRKKFYLIYNGEEVK